MIDVYNLSRDELITIKAILTEGVDTINRLLYSNLSEVAPGLDDRLSANTLTQLGLVLSEITSFKGIGQE